MNPNEIYQKLIDAGDDWADKEAAASVLEETKKSVLAKLKLASGEKSDAAQETRALADDEYMEFLKGMVQARQEANKAKVKHQSIKAWVDLINSAEASRRAEMRLA